MACYLRKKTNMKVFDKNYFSTYKYYSDKRQTTYKKIILISTLLTAQKLGAE
jgi:hypothetical protein